METNNKPEDVLPSLSESQTSFPSLINNYLYELKCN